VVLGNVKYYETYNVFVVTLAVTGRWYSPEGRSIVCYCPLGILSNAFWIVDKFFGLEEVFDNLNCTAAEDRSLGIQATVHLEFGESEMRKKFKSETIA
jgi:hypothetical protein